MAKVKRQKPESVSVTLANGTKVSGPAAAVARMVARHGEQKATPKRATKATSAPTDDE